MNVAPRSPLPARVVALSALLCVSALWSSPAISQPSESPSPEPATEVGGVEEPDVDLERIEREGIPYNDILPSEAQAASTPWASSPVSFGTRSGTPDINGSDLSVEAAIMRQVAEQWDEVSGIDLVEGGDNSDIRIDFYSDEHGDGAGFDGPYGVLAHAFFPGSQPLNGDIHFDEGETWTDETRASALQPMDLVTVALHEFGHALGLEHLDDPDAVMYASYDGSRRELTDTDINAIRNLYPLTLPFGDLQVDVGARPLIGQMSGAGGDDLQMYEPGRRNDVRYNGTNDDEFAGVGGSQFDIAGDYDETLVGDFNGDGLVDVWLHNAGSNNDRMLESTGQGTFRNYGTGSFDVSGLYDEYLVGDYSGDGRADLWLHSAGSGNDRMLVSQGSNSFANSGRGSFDIGGRYDEYLVADFSGDGPDDIWLYSAGSGNDRMLVAQSANNFTNYGRRSEDIRGRYDAFLVGNFSGSGGDDLHLYRTGSGNDRRLNSVGPNETNNYGTASQDIGGSFTRGLVGDYNGDGSADIVMDGGGDDIVVSGNGTNSFFNHG